MEMAVPIAQNLTTRRKFENKLVKIFLQEYQKYIRLNDEEKRALYFFIKYRLLAGASWCYDLIKKHPSQKEELERWAKIMIDKYRVFNKISSEEFLELVK